MTSSKALLHLDLGSGSLPQSQSIWQKEKNLLDEGHYESSETMILWFSENIEKDQS